MFCEGISYLYRCLGTFSCEMLVVKRVVTIPRNGTARNGPEWITIIRNLLYGIEENYYTEPRKNNFNNKCTYCIINKIIYSLLCVIGKVDNFLYKIHNILYSLGNTTTLLLWYGHWLCSTDWTWNHFKQVKYSIIVPSSGRRHKQKISTSKVPVVHMYTCVYAHA